MSRLLTTAAVLALGALTVRAVADGGAVGQPAPEIQIGDWIMGDGRIQLADFKGEVVLLEFWKTH